jgi:hypothetical protein
MTITLPIKTKSCKPFTIIEQSESAAPAKPVALPKRAKLAQLIEDRITDDPYEFEGFQWAAMAQPELAEMLGASVETLRRLISKPPFDRERTHVDGRIVTLLRIGEARPMTTRHVANIMANIWRKKTERRPGKAEYGCLCGLAEVWPSGEQISILKTVLADWTGYMSCVKAEMMVAEDAGEAITFKFFKHPVISVMRRWPSVAVELHRMKLQATGKQPAATAGLILIAPK